MELEPTEPNAMEPANWPTTAISARLNRICSTLDSTSGRLNSMICFHSEPLVRSCSCERRAIWITSKDRNTCTIILYFAGNGNMENSLKALGHQ